jgi:hypothetical protein
MARHDPTDSTVQQFNNSTGVLPRCLPSSGQIFFEFFRLGSIFKPVINKDSG